MGRMLLSTEARRPTPFVPSGIIRCPSKLYPLQFAVRPLVAEVAGVERRRRLEQQKPAFFISHRTVLNAARDNNEFAFFDPLVAVAELHAEAALDHQKELIFVVMMMKDEL